MFIKKIILSICPLSAAPPTIRTLFHITTYVFIQRNLIRIHYAYILKQKKNTVTLIPNLIEMTISQAFERLKSQGLENNQTYSFSMEIKHGIQRELPIIKGIHLGLKTYNCHTL